MTNDRNNKDAQLEGPDDEKQRMRLRPSGGYRTLCSFQTATVIYDATGDGIRYLMLDFAHCQPISPQLPK